MRSHRCLIYCTLHFHLALLPYFFLRMGTYHAIHALVRSLAVLPNTAPLQKTILGNVGSKHNVSREGQR